MGESIALKDTRRVSFSIFHPLDDFYKSSHTPLPAFKQIEPLDMPQPYRKLLVHMGDMTPTLENHYKDSIYLNVFTCFRVGDHYMREVVLFLNKSHQPIEFGAIKINLALFTKAAQQDIVEGHKPLGGILREQKILHGSRPKAFFSVESDAKIESALRMTFSSTLFGRRNTLLTPIGESLAEVVEILPPDNNQPL